MKLYHWLVAALLMLAAALPAGAQTATAQVALTPTATAYSAGQCLGGVMTVNGLVRSNGVGGTIVTQIDIVDTTGSNAAVDLLIFNAKPTGTYTDQANCTVAAADQPRLVGLVPNATFTCAQDQPATTGICQATPAILVTAATGTTSPVTATSFWVVAIMRGTPTYGSSKTLYFNFKGFPDN